MRRLPAAGVQGPGRRPQQPGVDLAAQPLPGALRRAPGTACCAARARRSTSTTATPGAGSPPTCRERGWSRSCATRSTGPTPTGCTCGWTASSRAPTSSRRAPRAAADRRRLGAVLALPRARHVRPPGGRPLRPLPARAGAAAALPDLVDEPAHGARPGLPLPRRRRRRRRRGAAGQLAAVRAPRAADPGARPGDPRGARPGQFLPPEVWRTAQQAARRPAAPARRTPEPAAADRPSSGEPCCEPFLRRHRRCSSRSPGSPSTTGARTATAARSHRSRARASVPGAARASDVYQVVRAVGPGRLEVEARASRRAAAPRWRSGSAPSEYGERRGRVVGDEEQPAVALDRRRRSSRASCPRRRPAVVQDDERVGVEHAVTRAPRASQVPGVGARTVPCHSQSRPSSLVASRVVIRSSWPGSVSGCSRPTSASRDSSTSTTGSLTATSSSLPGRHDGAPALGQLLGRVGVDGLDPPVLGRPGWRRRGRAASRRRGCGPRPVARTTRRRTSSRRTSQTVSKCHAVARSAPPRPRPRGPSLSGRRTR